jgi:poly(hydroxyalkanoate) depolymerase family esterase
MRIPLLVFLSLIGHLCFGQLTPVDLPFPNPGNITGVIHLSKKGHTSKQPLVVVLHGCSQDAAEIAHDSDWNKLSDSIGFHVLYPEQSTKNNLTNCFNWFLDNDHSKNKGEVYSIERLIHQTIDSFQIDTTRIFIYGVSAGGAMAGALLVDYPTLFNAGAIVGGVPFGVANSSSELLNALVHPQDKLPEEWAAIAKKENPTFTGNYPRLIALHGTADRVVPILAGYELIEQWTGLHDLTMNPSKREPNFQNVAGLTRMSFKDSLGVEQIVFYEQENWGHALMVDPGTGAHKGGNIGTFSKDGDWWSTYWIAVEFGLILSI